MNASQAISEGMMIPVIIGGIIYAIRLIHLAFQKVPTTIAEKEAAVFSRLYDRYREEGHENPGRAAGERMTQHYQIEEFRRYACKIYSETGKELSEILEEWWKEHGQSIRHAVSIGSTRADAAAYGRILKAAIAKETKDEIYIYQPAKRKWQDEKARLDAEFDRIYKMSRRYSTTDAHVINQMFAAGDSI